MRGAVLLVSLCACTVGPKLVSVPMLDFAPHVAPAIDLDNPASDDQQQPTVGLAGTWHGKAWQVGNKQWDLSVTFDKPEGALLVAHVQYPDQRCSAEWRLHTDEPRHWLGDESVRTDPFHRCADHGQVTLQLIDDDTLNWRWSGAGGTASATLERNAR
jgi:hypothetical protein